MPLPVAPVQATKGLTLEGSAVVIKDYLSFAINSILFQRDVCRPDEFEMVNKYGLPIMMMKDDSSVRHILQDAEKAMSSNGLKRVILALFEKYTDTVIEKWEFEIETDKSEKNNNNQMGSKNITLVQAEIRAVLKQVLGSVSFLPIIEAGSKFRILFVFEKGFSLPGWTTYHGSIAVNNSEEFVFKDFSTSLHKCATKVTYRS
ncbi:mitotic spindle assembly checkpoint protein MAD2A-like [Nasonia vitripennis]|uniref:HORMA domain-containing protein n=1 Tax=Nasonia vitripennis TaxID=7425 RepID=A0A7M7G9X8_NASVI|nr:mitotic spindle assembly checkpoint protein MAD2A-like [Nasonia vitripennis]